MNENERDLFNVCCTGQSYPFNDFVTGLHRTYTHCQHKHCRTCLNKGCQFICPRCDRPFGNVTKGYLDRRLNPEKYKPPETFNQLNSTPDYDIFPENQIQKTDEQLHQEYLEKNKIGCGIQFGQKRSALLKRALKDLMTIKNLYQ